MIFKFEEFHFLLCRYRFTRLVRVNQYCQEIINNLWPLNNISQFSPYFMTIWKYHLVHLVAQHKWLTVNVSILKWLGISKHVGCSVFNCRFQMVWDLNLQCKNRYTDCVSYKEAGGDWHALFGYRTQSIKLCWTWQIYTGNTTIKTRKFQHLLSPLMLTIVKI